MDFDLKQWRDESERDAEDQNPHPHPCALPLFFSEPNTNLSVPHSNPHHPNTLSANRFHRMGSYFSSTQWQELELQALIFRHMAAGASVPPELLHLVKKSLADAPYYHYYQPPLLQSGYWGRTGVDPEPGRCRRTDGKKWRCSRDVVAAQKYCERHMHRGRNRSRKPVETPTSLPYGGGAAETLKTHYSVSGQGAAAGKNSFTLTTTTPRSADLLHLNQRAHDSIIETKGGPFEPQDEGQSSGRTLHFFDDWPKPIHESGNATNYSDTNLSILMPGNPPSDFGLKLGTGGVGDGPSEEGGRDNNRNKAHLSWGMAWENNNAVAPMGGPLAEALRSSASNSSSPTSVLHRLARGNASETSFVTL